MAFLAFSYFLFAFSYFLFAFCYVLLATCYLLYLLSYLPAYLQVQFESRILVGRGSCTAFRAGEIRIKTNLSPSWGLVKLELSLAITSQVALGFMEFWFLANLQAKRSDRTNRVWVHHDGRCFWGSANQHDWLLHSLLLFRIQTCWQPNSGESNHLWISTQLCKNRSLGREGSFDLWVCVLCVRVWRISWIVSWLFFLQCLGHSGTSPACFEPAEEENAKNVNCCNDQPWTSWVRAVPSLKKATNFYWRDKKIFCLK